MPIERACRRAGETILGQGVLCRCDSDRLRLTDSRAAEARERETIGADLVAGMTLGMSLRVEQVL